MRMCVGCREMKEKRELIRIVRTPEGTAVLDSTGKRSGRGAYVCRHEECLKRSLKQRQLERSEPAEREQSLRVVLIRKTREEKQ